MIQDLGDLFSPLLPAHASRRSGFHEFKCPLCHDYKVRAGIRVSSTSIGFNCFNCGRKGSYEDGDCLIPRVLIDVYEALGGLPHDLNMLKLKLLRSEGEGESEVRVDGVNVFRSPPPLKVPKEFVTLESGLKRGEPQAVAVARYLLDTRSIILDPATVYVAITTKRSSPWLNRVILPTVMWGKIVAFSGRDITGTSPQKYYTDGAKGRAIYNFDITKSYPSRPLFVTEGQFDALRIDGVAVMGNTLSPHQIHWLSSVPRRKVVVPDRGKSGIGLAHQALALGWDVALPDIGSCKDLDNAVVQYGKLYCIEQLLSTITNGEAALEKVKLYCNGM